MTDTCPFCQPETDSRQHIVYENDLALFLQQPQPILKGSGLIVPKKHRETVFDLTEEEWRATFDLLNKVKKWLDEQITPDGYNVGWNAGTTAGQHIMHAHLHVIPRFGDEPFAGRGIRSWLKSEENRRK